MAHRLIQFRAPGQLWAEIEARVGATGASASETARRDLARYYELLRREREGLELSEAEASLICEALSGLSRLDEIGPQLAWAEVADAIRLRRLDERWGVDGPRLIRRLQELSPGQRVALADAVERFWAASASGETRPTAERLRAVGLVRDRAPEARR